MRLPSSCPLLLGTLLVFFVFNACVKPPPDFDPRNGDNVYTGCRIKSIGGIPILYNRNNDPVSFIHAGNAGTGNPNVIFKYDNRGRLAEYTAIFSNNSYGFEHRYGYNGNGKRIEADTFYFMGSYGVPNSYAYKNIVYPVYDNLNRVAKDSTVSVSSAGVGSYTIQQYDYFNNGNRITSYNYDDKLNPHRTNRVWMFINRDYSVNNPVPASAYNRAGLPLTFPSKDINDLQLMIYFIGGNTPLEYDCQ